MVIKFYDRKDELRFLEEAYNIYRQKRTAFLAG